MSIHNLYIADSFLGALAIVWNLFLLQIIPVFIPIVVSVILTATFTLIAATYWHNKTTKEKIAQGIANGHTLLMDRVAKVENQLALLSQAVVPLNSAFQDHLVKMLTHHHTPRVDLLLSKLKNVGSMTENETEELRVALQERTIDMGGQITPEERIAANILADVVKLTTIQAKDDTVSTKPYLLKLIAVETDRKEI
jgi:hypothetical protein